MIEINGFPNLNNNVDNNTIKAVKKSMLNDFIKLYVLPKVVNKKPIKGKWVRI